MHFDFNTRNAVQQAISLTITLIHPIITPSHPWTYFLPAAFPGYKKRTGAGILKYRVPVPAGLVPGFIP
jgi:hypothetical protein